MNNIRTDWHQADIIAALRKHGTTSFLPPPLLNRFRRNALQLLHGVGTFDMPTFLY
ncbi:helix-turn-helix domain-containing protein [Xenorhabdus sp. Sc-CR9]|uniref:helix-turn-helix domain-containing protein n=1 Tax=Xenorhabdus sp. Sc-CR9 TaxID=2584468 RepID=UPI001F2C7E18|nr:helix-turn-helix domain-containing protein [Xenorhabdus sp. Sc-CR9]